MNEVILKPGREKSALRRHPWIFSGAVDAVHGNPEKGETVRVLSAKNKLLGVGAYNPHSSIRIRLWAFGEAKIDEEFFQDKLRIAISLRKNLIHLNTSNGKRLIYAESDGIPGLIVDQYADYLVAQFLTAGIERWCRAILSGLTEITGIENIFERSDVDVRALEGLESRKGVLSGVEPPEWIPITENGAHFLVDIVKGQKTGFYLDQRANRKIIRAFVAHKTVLNCFAYTGGFTLNALLGGAEKVTSIESSTDAVALGKKNLEINDMDPQKCEWINGNVFQELRTMRDKGLGFDVIILDPPKFASTSAQVHAAARGYKDINLLAFKLLNAGGSLITFSCSGGISRELFQKIVADAALDAGVEAVVTDYLSQDKDHPVALNFPESEYLKGLVCRVK